jgi:hypothetical protein
MDEHGGRCSEDGSGDCPICRGEVSDEFIARIEQAASQPRRSMTFDEFKAWLDGLDTGSPSST